MPINMSQAKALCSASELQLVEASRRDDLKKLTNAQLRQKITRARKLRDKWRDQAEKQRRESQEQQQARATAPNERTRKKAELFAEVLRRFEEQLQKTERSADTGRSAERPSRRARTTAHREERAGTRKRLELTREEINQQPGETRGRARG